MAVACLRLILLLFVVEILPKARISADFDPILEDLRSLIRQTECERSLTYEEGELTSPNWPHKAVELLECSFQISTAMHKRLIMKFDQFVLVGNEKIDDCQEGDNFVQLTDPSTNRSEKICGNHDPFSWTSSGNTLDIQFQARSKFNFHLFHATFTSEEKDESALECGHIYFLQSFGLFTYNAPEAAQILMPLVADSDIINLSTLQRCEVYFHGAPGQQILLSFLEVDVLCAVPILISEPLSSRVTSLCGGHSSISWTSTTNEVVLRFTQNETSALDLEFTTAVRPKDSSAECSSDVFVETSGIYSSPSFPSSYPSNLDCWVLFYTDFSNILILSFTTFALEKGQDDGSCLRDYVQVQDVTTGRVERYCGIQYPFSWVSDSNEVLLSFHTNDIVSYSGFQIEYSTLERSYLDCFDFDDDEFHSIITSPNYPSNYPGGIDCYYVLHSPQSELTFVLEFTTFELEAGENCERDYLKITDITDRHTQTLCGHLPRFTITTVSNEVQLQFVSDQIGQEAGFKMTYKEVIKPVKETAGESCYHFIGPESRDLILHNKLSWPPTTSKDCLFVIHGHPEEFVTITFSEFKIDEILGNTTTGSSVSISDVLVTSKAREVTYTSDQPSFTWLSSTNEVRIRITAPSTIASVKLNAAVIFQRRIDGNGQECLHIHTSSRGDLTWPHSDEPQSNCHLIVQAPTNKRVILRISKLIFGENDCGRNFIEITDITTGKKDTYCSTVKLFAWISEGNAVQITISHLSLSSTIRMQATYLIVERPPETSYHQFFSEPSGMFGTTEHVQNEALEQRRSIVIRAKANEMIQLKFEDFLMGSTDERLDADERRICSVKSLMIQDMLNGRSENLCGKSKSFSWTSSGNLLHLFFDASETVAKEGFRASYEVLPNHIENLELLTNAKGIIRSEGFPGNYPNNHQKQWLLHADIGSLITLNFHFFNLQASEICSKDYLKIVDLSSNYEDILCGVKNPFAWTSESSELLLEFVTDDQGNQTGFQVEYEVIPSNYTGECFFQFSSRTGEFQLDETNRKSISDPLKDGFCQVLVHTDPDMKLHLVLSELVLDDCENAALILTDMGSLRTSHLCDLHHSLSWTSDTNEIFIYYVAYMDQFPDMHLKWTSVSREYPPGCFHVFTEEANNTIIMETIASNIPGTNCQYLFTLPAGKQVVLRIEYEFAADNDCSLNYIQIADPLTGRITQLCEAAQPFSWTSEGNEVFLSYHQTFENSTLNLFVVNFTSIHKPQNLTCSKMLLSEEGLLESPNHPLAYPEDLHCDTVIHVDPSMRIELTFESFHLEGDASDGCKSDELEIRDLATGRRELICGRLHPFVWISDSNEVLVHFVSDSIFGFSGYRATYQVKNRTSITTLPGCNITFTNESGNLDVSTDIPQYEGLVDVLCLYSFHGHPANKMVIFFNSLKLAKDAECEKSYIEIHDVISGHSDRMCGEHSPFEWTSVGNEVAISFFANDPGHVQNFRLEYKMVERTSPKPCDVIFTSTRNNEILSAGFSNGYYANDLDCTYTVIAGGGQLVQLTFDTVDIEYSEGCQSDFVKIETVGIGTSEQLCGVLSQYTWTSDGNVALITLHTDHVIRRQGFRAHFDFIATSERSPVGDCDQAFTSQRGIISSPNFPSLYHNNQDCKFLLTAKEGKVLQLRFSDFDLEYHPLCNYDYIEVKSEPHGTSSHFCGPETPPIWTSTTNRVLIVFHSDASGVYKGFSLTFDTVESPKSQMADTVEVSHCKQQFNWNMGFLASPNFPMEYPNNEHCQVDIQTSNGTRIEIVLYFIDIEEHYGCKWDYVQIKDTITNRVSEPLCGHPEEPFMWLSDSNHATVIFRSDAVLTGAGFYGNFVEVPVAV